MSLQGKQTAAWFQRASGTLWFVCAAHSDEDVAKTLHVFQESLTEALGEL
jgi:glutamate-1-semialdehyde aminotransferase